VHCCNDLRVELDDINFENIIISGCVRFLHTCMFIGTITIQHVQFRTKTITSSWTVNNFQTSNKWNKVFECSNSTRTFNDGFSNLNC